MIISLTCGKISSDSAWLTHWRSSIYGAREVLSMILLASHGLSNIFVVGEEGVVVLVDIELATLTATAAAIGNGGRIAPSTEAIVNVDEAISVPLHVKLTKGCCERGSEACLASESLGPT